MAGNAFVQAFLGMRELAMRQQQMRDAAVQAAIEQGYRQAGIDLDRQRLQQAQQQWDAEQPYRQAQTAEAQARAKDIAAGPEEERKRLEQQQRTGARTSATSLMTQGGMAPRGAMGIANWMAGLPAPTPEDLAALGQSVLPQAQQAIQAQNEALVQSPEFLQSIAGLAGAGVMMDPVSMAMQSVNVGRQAAGLQAMPDAQSVLDQPLPGFQIKQQDAATRQAVGNARIGQLGASSVLAQARAGAIPAQLAVQQMRAEQGARRLVIQEETLKLAKEKFGLDLKMAGPRLRHMMQIIQNYPLDEAAKRQLMTAQLGILKWTQDNLPNKQRSQNLRDQTMLTNSIAAITALGQKINSDADDDEATANTLMVGEGGIDDATRDDPNAIFTNQTVVDLVHEHGRLVSGARQKRQAAQEILKLADPAKALRDQRQLGTQPTLPSGKPTRPAGRPKPNLGDFLKRHGL